MTAQAACGMAAHDKVWPWTLGNAVRLTFAWWKMAPCIRSALTCMMLTFSAWYYPRVLRETGAKTRETGAKKHAMGEKKKVYHLTLLFWPSWRVARFWRPSLHMARTEGMVRREGAVMWSWACGGHAVSVWALPVLPSHLWVHALASFPLYLDSRRACFWILSRIHVMYLLRVVTVMLLCCSLNALHEDPSGEKINARLLMWCRENCAIAEGCLLKVSWVLKNILDVGVDTSDLPGPKLGCLHVLRCNPCCQAWLF